MVTGVLALAAAICSCNKEMTETDAQTTDRNRQIRFSAADDAWDLPATGTPSTKGAAIEDPGGASKLSRAGGFRVWAVSHADRWAAATDRTVLIDAAAVTGNTAGTQWSYDAAAEWPSNRYVSFFAYAPTDAASVTGDPAAGGLTLDFAVSTMPRDQTDLLIAAPLYDRLGPSYSYGQPVAIRFGHALSRIVFSGVVLNEANHVDGDGHPVARHIEVKSIRLGGLYYKGSAALDGPVSWSVGTAAADTAGYTVSTQPRGGLRDDVALSAVSQPLTADSGDLFLMPQMLVRVSAPEPTMAVTLEIDGRPVAYPPQPLFSLERWQPGRTYRYHIIVDGDDLRIVGIATGDLTLDPWDVEVAIQPVPMQNDSAKNATKLHMAVKALELLSRTGFQQAIPDSPSSPLPCYRYAVYLANEIVHDMTVELSGYGDFKVGDILMFDAKKLVTGWAMSPPGRSDEDNHALTVLYDGQPVPFYGDEQAAAAAGAVWVLQNAAQPQPELWSDPSYPGPDPSHPVDAVSGATTNTAYNNSNPSHYIRNKGSVIVKKISRVQ